MALILAVLCGAAVGCVVGAFGMLLFAMGRQSERRTKPNIENQIRSMFSDVEGGEKHDGKHRP